MFYEIKLPRFYLVDAKWIAYKIAHPYVLLETKLFLVVCAVVTHLKPKAIRKNVIPVIGYYSAGAVCVATVTTVVWFVFFLFTGKKGNAHT